MSLEARLQAVSASDANYIMVYSVSVFSAWTGTFSISKMNWSCYLMLSSCSLRLSDSANFLYSYLTWLKPIYWLPI
jgi:hypothetical protein